MSIKGSLKNNTVRAFVRRTDTNLKLGEKCSRQKAINLSLSYLKNVKEIFMDMNGSEAYMFNTLIDNGILTKELSMLTDYIYYNVKINDNFDIPAFGKEIYKMISDKDINICDLYKSKFCVSMILRTIGLDDDLLDITTLEIRALTLLYCSLNIIELIKCKTDKRVITGLEDNKLKYLNDNTLTFNSLNVRYNTTFEDQILDKYTLHISDRLIARFPHLDFTESLALANDKIDECLQSITIDNIMLSVLGIKSIVNRDTRIKSVSEGIASKVPVTIWENRDFICEEPEVLYFTDESNIKVMKVLDTQLTENTPVTVVSYVLKDGTEDTVILPNKQNSIMYSSESELVCRLEDFYLGKTENTVVLTEETWKFKDTKDFEGRTREYKKKTTYVRWHRAKMGNPSEEKLALAKKRGIVLKEGETWVKGHVRHYK